VKRDALDAAFSEAVRERDNWTCQNCGIIDTNAQMGGRPSVMDCSHIISRKYVSTRTYPDNALCICRGCHRKLGDNPPAHAKLAKSVLGETRYQWLTERHANNMIKYTKADKREMSKHYRDEVKRMRKERSNGFDGFIDLVAWD